MSSAALTLFALSLSGSLVSKVHLADALPKGYEGYVAWRKPTEIHVLKSLTDEEQRYIVAHESYHVREAMKRCDRKYLGKGPFVSTYAKKRGEDGAELYAHLMLRLPIPEGSQRKIDTVLRCVSL